MLGAILGVGVALWWRVAWSNWGHAAWGLASAYVMVAGLLAIVPAVLLLVGGVLWWRGRQASGRHDVAQAGAIGLVAAGALVSALVLVVLEPAPPQPVATIIPSSQGSVTIVLGNPVGETATVAATCEYVEEKVRTLDTPLADHWASSLFVDFSYRDGIRVVLQHWVDWDSTVYDGLIADADATFSSPDRQGGRLVFVSLPYRADDPAEDGRPAPSPASLSGSLEWACPPPPTPRP